MLARPPVFRPHLTREPVSFDEYQRPVYAVGQVKGLREHMKGELLADAIAEGYSAVTRSAYRQVVVQHIARETSSRRLDLLEVGGGSATFFDCIRESVRTYVNIEPGEVALDREDVRRLQDPRYACIRCSAEQIPLEDDSVDVALALASLDHIPDTDRALGEVRRLLRPNALFLVVLNNRSSWSKRLLAPTAYAKRRAARIDEDHYFQWSVSDCRAQLSRFFVVSDISTFRYMPFVPRLWRYVRPVADWIGPRLNRTAGCSLIAVCRKPIEAGECRR